MIDMKRGQFDQLTGTFAGTADVVWYIKKNAVCQRQAVEGDASTVGWSQPIELPTGMRWSDIASGSGTESVHIVRFRPDEREFNLVISRISQILQEDDFRPTEYALRTALTLVYEANQILKGVFARASVAVSEEGAISIYWRKPGRNLQLTVPAEEGRSAFIYHQENKDYSIERNAMPTTLANWLQWFMRV